MNLVVTKDDGEGGGVGLGCLELRRQLGLDLVEELGLDGMSVSDAPSL